MICWRRSRLGSATFKTQLSVPLSPRKLAAEASRRCCRRFSKPLTDSKGFYSFPSLAVGHYNILATANGFRILNKKDITIDADAALQIDLALEMAETQQELNVSETAADVQLDTLAAMLTDALRASPGHADAPGSPPPAPAGTASEHGNPPLAQLR